jgi:hypothetical protein
MFTAPRMQPIPRVSLPFLSLGLLLAALAASAGEPEDKAAAKKHFEVGLTLFKHEDFAAAAAEFELSVKLHPTKGGLFNLANAYRALHRYGEALELLERLNREFVGHLDEEMQGHVAQLTAEIRDVVASLTIEVDQPGATVKVDGATVGKSPLAAPLILGPGDHEIEVALAPYETEKRQVSIASGSEPVESFVLVRQSGELTVRTNVDGASVQIDGSEVGQTPLVEPLELPDGRHVVRISKDGYEPAEQVLIVRPGEKSSISLALASLHPAPEEEGKRHPLFVIGLTGTIVTGLATATFWGISVDYKNRYEDELARYDHQAETGEQDYSHLEWRRSRTLLFNRIAVGTTIATGVFAATMIVGIVISKKTEREQPVEVAAAPGGLHVRF